MGFSKDKIFLYACVSFIVGIAIASFLPEQFIIHKFWYFFGALGSWILAIIFYTKKQANIFAWRLLFLLSVFLFLGFWRYSLSLPESTSDKVWFFNGRAAMVSGIITSGVEERENNQKFELTAEYLILSSSQGGRGGAKQFVSGKILVTAGLYPRYRYGDRLMMQCELAAPEQFSGFAYDRYLARYDIYSLCYYGEIEIINKDQGNWFYARIFRLRDKLRRLVNIGLSGQEASLARAILLGDKKGIAKETKDRFSRIGLSHIIAISGLHISIIAVILMYLLIDIGLNRKQAYYAAIIILALYIVLIGLPASALRAGLMAFLVLTALKIGRLTRVERSITIAAAVILLFNPRLLRDDIGFILSFLAVLSIAFLYPIFDDWWDRTNIAAGKTIRDIFFITMAVQIFTWPILVYNFSLLSIVAPLSNILVLWTLPFIIISGILAIAVSWLLPVLGLVWFLPLKLLINYIIFIARALSAIPFAYIEINSPGFIWLALYYAGLAILITKIRKKI